MSHDHPVPFQIFHTYCKMPAAGQESKNDHERPPPQSALRRKSTGDLGKMAAQSQGIKQLMAAEKEAAQVVANSRKRE